MFRRSGYGYRWAEESEGDADGWEGGFAEHSESVLLCFEVQIDE